MKESRHNEIKQMCEALDFPEGKLSNEYLFTIEAVDCFFYERNIQKNDIQISFVDGGNDGGIDYIFNNDDTVFFIQGKSSTKLTFDDIKNVFYKAKETIQKLKLKTYDQKLSTKIPQAYLNAINNCSDDYPNYCIVLFTNTILTDQNRIDFEAFSKLDDFEDYQLKLYDYNDIENKEAVLDSRNDLIKSGKLEIYTQDKQTISSLRYGDNGLIVNISARSLKLLFDQYREKLFSYNLRDFIAQKNVDDGIEKSIKFEPNNFWYYNNGITIGCESFEQSGTKLQLYNFSIINGAQTTTQISKCLPTTVDFALVCKVIKSDKAIDDDQDFIRNISEATNSQKPIKPRDIKANAKEQLILKKRCYEHNPPIYVEIKRGRVTKLRKSDEKWQKVTNEYIGQLICSCILQKPGTARNSKRVIFSNDQLYNSIFKRKYDVDTLFDLVRIAAVFDSYIERVSDEYASCNDEEQKEKLFNKLLISRNGKFAILALIIYIHFLDTGKIKNYKDTTQQISTLISGYFITNYPNDDLEEKLFSLFDYIIYKLENLYDKISIQKNITSYSNFFKTDTYYTDMQKNLDELWSQSWEKPIIEQLISVIQ